MLIRTHQNLVALTLTVIVASAPACGGGEPSKTRGSIAKAFENSDPKAAAEKASEDMKRLKARAAEKAEAEVREAIEAAAFDDGDGGDLKALCAAMRDAHDRFVQRRLASDPLELDRWNVFKPMDLDKLEDACRARKSAAVARCQRHAFDTAPLVVTRGRAGDLTERCVAKYGSTLGAGPGVAAPPAG